MAIFNYSGIRSLLFEYSNNIRSQKSDRISNRITLFGTQLFEYSNNLNYSFKHWFKQILNLFIFFFSFVVIIKLSKLYTLFSVCMNQSHLTDILSQQNTTNIQSGNWYHVLILYGNLKPKIIEYSHVTLLQYQIKILNFTGKIRKNRHDD